MLEGSVPSPPSTWFVICRVVNVSHSEWCEVVPRSSFDLHFCVISDICIFSCACWPPVCLLWRNIYLGLLPVFQLGCFVVVVVVVELYVFVYFGG